jgi:hypothetical protein
MGALHELNMEHKINSDVAGMIGILSEFYSKYSNQNFCGVVRSFFESRFPSEWCLDIIF